MESEVPAKNIKVLLHRDHFAAGIFGIGNIEKAMALGISPVLNLFRILQVPDLLFGFIVVGDVLVRGDEFG